MMAASQTRNGKAFEYACLMSINEYCLRKGIRVNILATEPFITARNFYQAFDYSQKCKLYKAAEAATNFIVLLEPQIEFAENNQSVLQLSLQADSKGEAGDVRDVLCLRSSNGWNVGLSCKHNHDAVKHSRLSGTIDFGQKWFNDAKYSCSAEYFNKVRSIFDKLGEIKRASNSTAKWDIISDKEESVYVPILTAFMQEIKRIDRCFPGEIPRLLIHYLIGANDFYKVIADDARRLTCVEAFNINGSLNRSSGDHHPLIVTKPLELPSYFFHIDFLPNKRNTILLVCDKGWAISMRIHNASSRIEPSLKFDVRIEGYPKTLLTHFELWK